MESLSGIKTYIFRYRPKGLIIDTNILILFLVGTYDKDYIHRCKLTSKYSSEDFELLKKIVGCFKKIIITPYVLAELSNLSKKDIKGKKLQEYFKIVINFLESSEEESCPISSFIGAKIELISQFGFTDMAIFQISKKTKMPILTNEVSLYAYSANYTPTINFEHIKNSDLTAKLNK